MAGPGINVPAAQVEAFCRKWRITEFALFGSVLREDFGPDSDVDVLVTFAPDHGWGLYELVDMQDELEVLFGRKVDLVMRGGLTNPFRRHEILRTRQVLYAA
jgi:predicted nucleotidyltransferase